MALIAAERRKQRWRVGKGGGVTKAVMAATAAAAGPPSADVKASTLMQRVLHDIVHKRRPQLAQRSERLVVAAEQKAPAKVDVICEKMMSNVVSCSGSTPAAPPVIIEGVPRGVDRGSGRARAP